MARPSSDILADALALSLDQRAKLARALIDSLESDENSATAAEVEAAWRIEVERRDAELDANPGLAVPAQQVFANAERELQRLRDARDRAKRSA
ncbi:MAG: addiction module protein [Longimicrobiales bacterium]